MVSGREGCVFGVKSVYNNIYLLNIYMILHIIYIYLMIKWKMNNNIINMANNRYLGLEGCTFQSFKL